MDGLSTRDAKMAIIGDRLAIHFPAKRCALLESPWHFLFAVLKGPNCVSAEARLGPSI